MRESEQGDERLNHGEREVKVYVVRIHNPGQEPQFVSAWPDSYAAKFEALRWETDSKIPHDYIDGVLIAKVQGEPEVAEIPFGKWGGRHDLFDSEVLAGVKRGLSRSSELAAWLALGNDDLRALERALTRLKARGIIEFAGQGQGWRVK